MAALRIAVLAVLAACSSVRGRPLPSEPALAPPALRLPGDVRPTRYALELTVVPDQPRATGRIHIAAQVVAPTRVVWLNATGLAIGGAALAGRAVRVIAGGDDFIGLIADRELPAGPLAIDLAFSAAIDPVRSVGIYSEREADAAYAYTLFEPIDARRAFPCFDEPSYKVPWQLTLHVRRDHAALGNAPVVRELDEPAGMKRVEFAATRPLPSYLVAFVVGPFELVDGGTAGRIATPIRFVVPRGRAGELGYSREVTPRIVAALEDYFDSAYPYGKLDVAVVPRYAGTMEHPGLVAMGQQAALIRPDQATRERRASYAIILAHELSHYWFGDLVTMAWWDDTWLNEALGEWSDMNITDAAEPSWRYRDERVAIATAAMAADEALSTQAIRQPVTTRDAIAASFDAAITYAKGAAMFRMFEAFAGREPWRRFVQRYLADHAWGTATAEQFLRGAADRLGPGIAAGLRSFLDQPGVPRIAAALSCEPGRPPRLALTQQRALPAGVRDPEPRRWWVPVCLRYGDSGSSHRQCVELTAESAEVDLVDRAPAIGPAGGAGAGRAATPGCPSWLILNGDAIGYYRSAVDPALVRALFTEGSAIARRAQPTPSERMMLVEDLRAAVSRGELALEPLLALVPVIAADRDPRVARWAVTAADLPIRGLDPELRAAARRWYHRAFHARAAQLGWQRGERDSDELHELRRQIVPLVADDDPALAAEAARLADRWLAENAGSQVRSGDGRTGDDLVWSALAIAAHHGDAARFDRMLAAASAARDRSERERLLTALGSFNDPDLAARALGLLRDPGYDLRDTLGIASAILDRPETRDLGLSVLTGEIDRLLGRMRDDEAANWLGELAGKFCDPERRARIAALVAPRTARIAGAQPLVARALELADRCIARLERQRPALRRALLAQ